MNIKKYTNTVSSTEEEKELINLRKAVDELQLLNEVAIAAGRTTDLDSLLEIIVAKIREEIKAEQCSIILLTEDTANPFITLAKQDDQSKLRKKFDVYDQIIGLTVKNGKTINIKNLRMDTRFAPDKNEKNLIKNVLCSPVWYKGKTLGVFILVNKKGGVDYDSEDQRLLSIISSQTGQLIKNTELQKESLQKKELEQKLKITEIEKEKLEELVQLKKTFFENISHEFRTPLTLILGPTEQLINSTIAKEKLDKLNIVRQNTSRLLNLVNQMLELSVIELNNIKLDSKEIEIVEYISNIVKSFQPFAESKKVTLKFNSLIDCAIISIDKDKLHKVIYNILSNAVKFNKPNGSVYLELKIDKTDNGKKIKLDIEDTGIGICQKEINKIFDRFFQSKNKKVRERSGFGIGLSLAKELIELHNGRIEVESILGKGSKFSIVLPPERIKKINYLKEQNRTEVVAKKNLKTSEDYTKLIIIDDNPDVREFVKSLFEDKFIVIESEDGNNAIDLINQIIPDIIISDQVMPGYDGIDLCHKIKNDEKTSHIPFILLTAKAEDDFKLEAYKSGVDDFIIKPFSPEELLSRTDNLIKSRNLLKEHYCEKVILEPTKITIVNKDEEFLVKAVGVIEKHIEEPDFTVEQFGEELFMSRTQLYRKIHALTGKSVRELITSIRLKRATRLLEKGYGTIAEVAFKVGFNEAAYFSKRFHEEIGCPPSEYIQKAKK